MGFVINEKNYKGIPGISSIAKRIGADYIQFKPEIRRPGTPQVDPNFFKKEVFPLITVAEQYSDKTFNVMVTSYRFNDVLSPETNHGGIMVNVTRITFKERLLRMVKHIFAIITKGERLRNRQYQREQPSRSCGIVKKEKVIEFLDSTDLSQCQICCRNHELNKFLFHRETC